jgi:hypothetical protein
MRLSVWQRFRARADASRPKQPPDAIASLRKLVEARNESDAPERTRLIEECLQPHAAMVEGSLTVRGREEIRAWFAQNHSDPEHSVTIIARVQKRDDRVWTRWQVEGLHEDAIVQTVSARVAPDGRLAHVVATPALQPTPVGPWRRLFDALAGNPVAAAGVLGGATYLALRIPTAVFYSRLGTTPDDVGLGPQVLVPQSLLLLATVISVVIGAWYVAFRSKTTLSASAVAQVWNDERWLSGMAAFALGAVVWCGVWLGCLWILSAISDSDLPLVAVLLVLAAVFSLASLLAGFVVLVIPAVRHARRALVATRRRRKDKWERNNTQLLGGGLFAVGATLVVLLFMAIIGSDGVVNGGDARARFFPWKAVPAQVAWKPGAAEAKLTNRCAELRLLGIGNNEIVLFDTELDRTFRVPVADATVATSVGCLWIREVSTYSSHKRCSAGRCSWSVQVSISTSHSRSREDLLLQKGACRNGACTYEKPGTKTAPFTTLAGGRYRLIVTSTYRGQTAHQTTDFVVP